jgi:dolichyl-phosphate beta-glucosyltransferase
MPSSSSPAGAPVRRGIDLATLSVVIPAFNEEERLPALLASLAGSARDAAAEADLELLETLLIDDGSTDRTRRVLSEAAASDETIRPVLELERNHGKGAAVAAGVARARGKYVLLADVDLSTPLDELWKLSAAIRRGADIAVGSRAVSGAEVDRGPAHRKVTGRAFSAVVRMMTGLGVRDTQNGFKLLRAEAARALLAEQVCPGFAFDVELLLRAELAGMRIEEVPVRYVHDPRSRVRVAPASLTMLREVGSLSLQLRPRRGAHPAPDGWPSRSLGDRTADHSD